LFRIILLMLRRNQKYSAENTRGGFTHHEDYSEDYLSHLFQEEEEEEGEEGEGEEEEILLLLCLPPQKKTPHLRSELSHVRQRPSA